MNKMALLILTGGVIVFAVVGGFVSRGLAEGCQAENRSCVIEMLQKNAPLIEEASWRDQTYRELAKTLAFDGRYDEAMTTLGLIENPDTQALTVRGIGMAAAASKISGEAYDDVFQKLRAFSETISHPPSYAIALTYIAMAQAFAGDHEGAWATAASMENDALRHKAYGETSEIQAEQGDFDAAMKSISLIESDAFRNKSYGVTSKIFADAKQLDHALNTADKITNPYKKASALQYILDIQKPREMIRD
jgi:predicted negative regulator of RcsB-dependent stress response